MGRQIESLDHLVEGTRRRAHPFIRAGVGEISLLRLQGQFVSPISVA